MGEGPQLEYGYCRIANELMESITQCKAPGSVIRTFLAVVRETYGYQSKRRQIRRRRLAELLDVGERRARSMLADAAAWGMVSVTKDGIEPIKDCTLWRRPEGKRKPEPELWGTGLRSTGLRGSARNDGGPAYGVPGERNDGVPVKPVVRGAAYTSKKGKTDVLNDVTPSAPTAGAAPEKPAREESPQQVCVREAFERLTGESLPEKLPGYASAMKVLTEYGIPTTREWMETLPADGSVPEGADSWKYFVTSYRKAMSRDFEWRRDRKLSPGTPSTLRDPEKVLGEDEWGFR